MTSTKTFETSLNEMKAIEKRLAFDQVTINMNKLDPQTKNDMIAAIANCINKRKPKVIDVIQGASIG